MARNVFRSVAILAAPLLLAAVQSASADLLLLGDDFTVTGTPDTYDANYNVPLRQTGAAAPASWSRSIWTGW